jgi:predicted nuclease of predicted toxin-antitoxin system
MRFIVDTNLPPALAIWLAEQGHDAIHTIDVGLGSAADSKIWKFAGADACIVTKDEDFVLLKVSDSKGPRVVWVRIGNAVRRVVIKRFQDAWPEVLVRLHAGEPIVEVR